MNGRSWSAGILPALCMLLCLGVLNPSAAVPLAQGQQEAVLYFFWGTGCPHCEEAKPFIESLKQSYPELRVVSLDIMADRENLRIWSETATRFGTSPSGVPAFYFDGQSFVGFSGEIEDSLRKVVKRHFGRGDPTASPDSVRLPLVGEVIPSSLPLPVFTVVIAALDSFNPCAFFVLLFLLSLLVHAHSRSRMLLVGGTFVLCSGLVYFLFMAAWLNLFLLLGQLSTITGVAGVFALLIGAVNVKDFFFFKKGVSLSIPESAKPGLFARMRGLVRSESMPSLLGGTLFLALAVNSYELLCTAGFPMVYTRVLTLSALPPGAYYGYLAFYNLIYVIPLAAIVGLFTWTLGARKLSEGQGRALKLLAGMMMLMLGAVLVLDPSLLSNALASAVLLGAALLLTGGILLLSRMGKRGGH